MNFASISYLLGARPVIPAQAGTVIPAQAGTQTVGKRLLDARLRGHDNVDNQP